MALKKILLGRCRLTFDQIQYKLIMNDLQKLFVLLRKMQFLSDSVLNSAICRIRDRILVTLVSFTLLTNRHIIVHKFRTTSVILSAVLLN
jgi:hypothetical protein